MTIRAAFAPVLWLNLAIEFARRAHRELKRYRNPFIYARELVREMNRDGLSRRELAERHGVSPDRITQWLGLLNLSEEKLREIDALGDYWETQVITERCLRFHRRNV